MRITNLFNKKSQPSAVKLAEKNATLAQRRVEREIPGAEVDLTLSELRLAQVKKQESQPRRVWFGGSR